MTVFFDYNGLASGGFERVILENARATAQGGVVGELVGALVQHVARVPAHPFPHDLALGCFGVEGRPKVVVRPPRLVLGYGANHVLAVAANGH
jgi:hypothetical protein